MFRNARGFTLVEVCITVLVLALISAATFPCYVRSRSKAREAEVKSNIHSIQIALERRAVDTGGIYPTFLIGADSQCNSLLAQYDPRFENSAKIKSGATPFAKKPDSSLANQQNCFITRDPLIEYGYLTQYPRNPFAKRDDGMWNGVLSTKKSKPGQFPFGGEHGDLMFDLSFGWADTPQTDFVMHKNEQIEEDQDDGKNIFADPDLDAPGNFYYHPMFADMLPVYVHYLAQYNEVYNSTNSAESSLKAFGVSDHRAIGFYLYGYGQGGKKNSTITKGHDLFNRMPADDSRQGAGKFAGVVNLVNELGVECTYELDSSINSNQKRVETTGYTAGERDPWTGAYADAVDPNDPSKPHSRPGPDGVRDWVIITVSSGCDMRTPIGMETYTYGSPQTPRHTTKHKYKSHTPLGGVHPSVPPPAAGGTHIPNREPYDTTYYENYGANPLIPTEDENTSTFGMDVDTASYTIARRYIFDGNIPDKDSIRTEEFINYFDHQYPEPEDDCVFSITCEGAVSEFGRPNYHLLKIGIKAMDVSFHDRPPANMVFIIDVSGSMNREDRLEQVKRSLRMLGNNLKRGDRVGLVVYGSRGEVICEPTWNHEKIMRAIDRLHPGGSTNAEEGLILGYNMARENYEEGKINRIILCSDGVANVGNTRAETILARIRDDAEKGITLTTIGFGMGNYNDVLMEKLADNGDGMYFYVDNEEEAGRVFGDGATRMLLTLASDAKIQVVFNEDTVDRFRLLGYENRYLEKEDFEDDSVDAGEVNAGQSVTALYEIRIRDDQLDWPWTDIATVKVRYMYFPTGEIETDQRSVKVHDMEHSFRRASRDFRFTACVAEFAEILKEDYSAKDGSLANVLKIADRIARNDKEREFVKLVERTMYLMGDRK